MLREARERAGLSQQALAEKAGVAIRTVIYAEGGRDIRVSTAWRLALALGCSLEELFPESEQVPA